MDAVHSKEGFAYALVSAVPLQDADATGIGIVYRARDRSTVRTECRAVEDTETLAATYEALMRVLDQARSAKVRRITIYVDDPSVIGQLRGDAEVPRELLGVNLQTRAKLHRVGGVRLVAAHSPRFSARLLAESALLRTRDTEPTSAKQLTLLPEDALA